MSIVNRIDRSAKVREHFHQAKWDEPVIYELSTPGERGILVPQASEEVASQVEGIGALPAGMKRKNRVNLPEISQNRVLRHYLRLSQQVLGADVNIEIGQGTCTMKYSPKVNEQLARGVQELHPLQDPSTVQGMLEIYYQTDRYMCEISGMDRFTFQPGGGSQGILAMASVKAAVSERTAAYIVANPEDTGVYNGQVQAFTAYVHEHGGLCAYDQANANGLLGVTRAREAGFDLCFFNLHKTFSSPHGCGGPACGATGVSQELVPFLPAPLVGFDGERYFLDYAFANKEFGVGKIRSFYGVAQVVLRAYAWIRSLGGEGLYQVAKTAVLNNNYLFKKMLEIPGIGAYYCDGNNQRGEQARYTVEKVYEETGVSTGDIQRRAMDFGLHYWTSHHPYYLPEPITLEPTETPSKADIDEYVETMKYIFNECRENPEVVKTAPHRSTVHQIDESGMDDPAKWAVTWKMYLKKYQ